MRKKPLVFCSGTQGAVVTYDYKLYYNKGKFELYKLPQDPSEQNDISASHPDEVKNSLAIYISKCLPTAIHLKEKNMALLQ